MKRLYILFSATVVLALLVVSLFVGCAKEEEPVQFILSGRVRVNGKVNENAKVKMELCKGIKWYKNDAWNTVTDKWGSYSIIIDIDWFQCDYRVRIFAEDTTLLRYDDYYGHWAKVVNTYISDWQYGTVKWGTAELNFALDETDRMLRQDEIIEKEGPREKRYKD